MFGRVAGVVSSVSTDLKLVPWQAPAVQSFLEAQFDERPFAFVLVDGDSVHVGEDAVERLSWRYGLPDSLATLLRGAYRPVAGPFGRVVHGREPADLHGTFPLTDEARAHLEPLRRSLSIPVDPE